MKRTPHRLSDGMESTKPRATDPVHRPTGPTGHDECLFERAGSHWQQGDWASLIQIGHDSIENHPDRAKLALLIASAHLQAGKSNNARPFIHSAREWGCSDESIARILVSNVHNSIARTAAAAGDPDKARQHFEQSISIGFPGCDASALARSRNERQVRDLGLAPGSQGRLQQLKALCEVAGHVGNAGDPRAPIPQAVNRTALDFYHNLDAGDAPPPFLLIDSKSMPRSGLHYLKNTFTRLLGDHFSFCEWYHEFGCCRQHPCAVTSYAQFAKDTDMCRIRLIKSHDFENADPVLEPGEHLQRLILVRDPLYTLTSWFELDQLNLYEDLFRQHGINIQKVWLLHEKEVLASTYKLLDTCFKEPTAETLAGWLVDKSNYIIGFMNRWVKPALDQPHHLVHLVAYDEIDRFVIKIMENYRAKLSPVACKALDDFAERKNRQFQQRTDPFTAKSASMSAFLRKHSSLFEEAARKVRLNDQSGYLLSRAGS